MPIRTKKVKRKPGDVAAILLPNGKTAYGRVLKSPLMAFYDLASDQLLEVNEVVTAPVSFKIAVMTYVVTDGHWQIIGNAALDASLLEEPLFFKKDSITKKLSIYQDSTGFERPATPEECEGLECAAVWEPEHVVDRLMDHFAGRKNAWVESLKP